MAHASTCLMVVMAAIARNRTCFHAFAIEQTLVLDHGDCWLNSD
jgi:hypothetical protein